MAIFFIERNEFEKARFRVDDHIDRFGDSGKAQFIMALTYHKDKKYALARPHFDKALELDPDYPHTNYFYGYCLFYLGELSDARAAFEAHLQAVPDHADSIFGLGLIDLEENRLDEAEKNFRKSIEIIESALNPGPLRVPPEPRKQRALLEDAAKGYARLSDVLVRREQLVEARDALVKATSLWPDHYEAWHKLSRVLYRLGDEAGAKRAERMHDEVRRRIHPPQAPAQPSQEAQG